jgi:Secretion system C-terminal sorting domain
MKTITTFFLSFAISVCYTQQFKLKSKSLAEFNNSFSIQLHVGKDIGPGYFQPYVTNNLIKVLEPLQELGIKHVRDDINFYNSCNPCSNATCNACLNYDNFKNAFNRMKTVYETTGAKFQLVIPYRDIRNDNDTFVIKNPVYLDSLFTYDNGSAKFFVEAIEGFNEVNTIANLSDTTWTKTAFEMQKSMYRYMKSKPDLAPLKVLNATLYVGGNGYNATTEYKKFIKYARNIAFPNDSLHDYFDVATLHAYPTSDGYPQGYPNYDINRFRDSMVNEFGTTIAGKPVYLTETGYHQGVQPTENYNYISELAMSKYLSILFPDNFRNNITRTNIYELLDHGETTAQIENQEGNFGLVRRDGVKKQAFFTMKNLIHQTLPDTYSFVEDSLTINVSGDNANLQYLLLRKNFNKYQLMIWQGNPQGICYDGTGNTPTGIDIASDTQKIMLTLPNIADSVKVYYPHTQINYTQKIDNINALNIGVSDNVVILDISFPLSVLPVKWESTTASLNNNNVIINWKTSNEYNVKEFHLEKATPRDPIFTEIGRVSAKNSSINSYSYIDSDLQNIDPASKILYRVKQIDFNNNFQFSTVAIVQLPKYNSTSTTYLYPNPSTDLVEIKGAPVGKDMVLSLQSLDGKLIKRNDIKNNANTIRYDISSIPRGLYIITIGIEHMPNQYLKLIKK